MCHTASSSRGACAQGRRTTQGTGVRAVQCVTSVTSAPSLNPPSGAPPPPPPPPSCALQTSPPARPCQNLVLKRSLARSHRIAYRSCGSRPLDASDRKADMPGPATYDPQVGEGTPPRGVHAVYVWRVLQGCAVPVAVRSHRNARPTELRLRLYGSCRESVSAAASGTHLDRYLPCVC